MAKFGLGKGLDALLPSEEEELTEHGNVISAPLAKIRANPEQPRKLFDETALNELSDSIKEHGVIQPLIVEEDGDGYIIVAGERRFRAARRAGLTEAPVIVRAYSHEKRLQISLIENIQRTDLNPVEEAAAYKALMELTGKTQDEVSLMVGKNRSTVANALRLLKLSPTIQESLKKGEISPGHARALLAVENITERERLFNEIVLKGLSVREAEKRASGEAGKKNTAQLAAKAAVRRDPHLAAMEEKFIETLGTKVSIDGDFSRGVIRIEYYSMQDLERIYEIIKKQVEGDS